MKGLGLSKEANQRIGTPIQKGISGGQKRRVTVGTSLITLPKVLFLDEPTSGLDSQTSFEVMNSIKGLAKEFQIIVIASVHSPNWETCEYLTDFGFVDAFSLTPSISNSLSVSLFDQTLLMAQGHQIFRGPTLDVAPYFSKLGYVCPEHTNPADFAMSLVSTEFKDEETVPMISAMETTPNKVMSIDEFAQQFKSHQKESQSENNVQNLAESGRGGKSVSQVQDFKSFWFKTWILTYRNWWVHVASRLGVVSLSCGWLRWLHFPSLSLRLNYSRNILAYGVRAAMYVGMGIL